MLNSFFFYFSGGSSAEPCQQRDDSIEWLTVSNSYDSAQWYLFNSQKSITMAFAGSRGSVSGSVAMSGFGRNSMIDNSGTINSIDTENLNNTASTTPRKTRSTVQNATTLRPHNAVRVDSPHWAQRMTHRLHRKMLANEEETNPT